jgi:hypothetical protein
MDILAKQAGGTDKDALQELHEAFQVFTRLTNLHMACLFLAGNH